MHHRRFRVALLLTKRRAVFLNFSNLTEDPFRITPDPAYLYQSEQYAKARAYLKSDAFLADGFVALTGDAGTGKTILIRDLLRSLGPDVIAVEIHKTQISPVDFLPVFLAELGLDTLAKSKAESMRMVTDFLARTYRTGTRTLLVIDEAQHLSVDVLDEIRLLANIGKSGQPGLSIILAGQPEFRKTLGAQNVVQINQRVPLNIHLRALDRLETESYVKHRLSVAGDKRCEIFAADTFAIIHRQTRGVPRLINSLCGSSMLCAFADDLAVVTADTVNTAVEELHWVPFMAVEGPTAPANGSHYAQRLGAERRLEHVEVARVQAELAQSALAEAERAEARRAAAERLAKQLGRQFKKVAARNEQLASELKSKEALLRNYQQAIRKLRDARRRAVQKYPVPAKNAAHMSVEDDAELLSVLVPLDDRVVTKHAVKEGRLTLGSGSDNDVQIKSAFTSRHHAQIITTRTESVLGDLGSSNGTYVNGRRVNRHALRHGDLITMGKHRFKYLKRQDEASKLSSHSNVYRLKA